MSTFSAVVTIVNELGMHARPATAFKDHADRFASEITVERTDGAGAVTNAGSMLGLLGLALTCGTDIRISADGPDAEEAGAELVALVKAGFQE